MLKTKVRPTQPLLIAKFWIQHICLFRRPDRYLSTGSINGDAVFLQFAGVCMACGHINFIKPRPTSLAITTGPHRLALNVTTQVTLSRFSNFIMQGAPIRVIRGLTMASNLRNVRATMKMRNTHFNFRSINGRPIGATISPIMRLPTKRVSTSLRSIRPTLTTRTNPRLQVKRSNRRTGLRDPSSAHKVTTIRFSMVNQVRHPGLFNRPLRTFKHRPHNRVPPRNFINLQGIIRTFTRNTSVRSKTTSNRSMVIYNRRLTRAHRHLHLVFTTIRIIICIVKYGGVVLGYLRLFKHELNHTSERPAMSLPQVNQRGQNIMIRHGTSTRIHLTQSHQSRSSSGPFIARHHGYHPLQGH